MKYPNGDVYVGEWSNGLKSGFGRYKFAADKSQLIGTWQHGRLKHGRWQLPSGIYYTGMFKRNKPCGKGVWVFPNGNQVIGEYIQKVRQSPKRFYRIPPLDMVHPGPSFLYSRVCNQCRWMVPMLFSQ